MFYGLLASWNLDNRLDLDRHSGGHLFAQVSQCVAIRPPEHHSYGASGHGELSDAIRSSMRSVQFEAVRAVKTYGTL